MSSVEAGDFSDAAADACGPTSVGRVGLRVGAIFIILVTSLVGTLFPILSKRVIVLRRAVPGWIFEFAKFFGSGVILATGLLHLLEPATEAIGDGSTRSAGGCINDAWGNYPYAFAICLISLFLTFVTQMCAFRLGTARFAKLGVKASPHIHVVGHPGHVQEQDRAATIPGPAAELPGEADSMEKGEYAKETDVENQHFHDASEQNPFVAQLLGVATLEFGVVLHSVIIGLTLATTEDAGFTTLFVVIIFHQMFEGLGLGTRLSFLKLDPAWSWIPWIGALLYSLCTPIGMAVGLGVREGLSMSGATASITSGVLDAFSSGILLYTATVELLAHEFIFNKFYHTCSWKRLFFSLACFAAGAGVMALLGKWA